MGVNQVPVVVNVHCVPAVVVFGALELVAGAVVQTLGKSCQHRTEQAGIPTARVISLYSTEILQHFKVIIWTQFFYLKIYKNKTARVIPLYSKVKNEKQLVFFQKFTICHKKFSQCTLQRSMNKLNYAFECIWEWDGFISEIKTCRDLLPKLFPHTHRVSRISWRRSLSCFWRIPRPPQEIPWEHWQSLLCTCSCMSSIERLLCDKKNLNMSISMTVFMINNSKLYILIMVQLK